MKVMKEIVTYRHMLEEAREMVAVEIFNNMEEVGVGTCSHTKEVVVVTCRHRVVVEMCNNMEVYKHMEVVVEMPPTWGILRCLVFFSKESFGCVCF